MGYLLMLLAIAWLALHAALLSIDYKIAKECSAKNGVVIHDHCYTKTIQALIDSVEGK